MTDHKILVLEDETLIALDIEMTLNEVGFDNVVVCRTNGGAMEAIENGVPRMALLDVNLGKGETSIEVALRLQELGVPFVFLTGYSNATVPFPESLTNVRRVSKPFRPAELQNIMKDEVGITID